VEHFTFEALRMGQGWKERLSDGLNMVSPLRPTWSACCTLNKFHNTAIEILRCPAEPNYWAKIFPQFLVFSVKTKITDEWSSTASLLWWSEEIKQHPLQISDGQNISGYPSNEEIRLGIIRWSDMLKGMSRARIPYREVMASLDEALKLQHDVVLLRGEKGGPWPMRRHLCKVQLCAWCTTSAHWSAWRKARIDNQ